MGEVYRCRRDVAIIQDDIRPPILPPHPRGRAGGGIMCKSMEHPSVAHTVACTPSSRAKKHIDIDLELVLDRGQGHGPRAPTPVGAGFSPQGG